MNWQTKKIIRAAIILVGSGLGVLASTQSQAALCPTLTANDIQNVINYGTISTDQGYTLADEAGKTRAQVLIDEPTANPFDTYYSVWGKKTVLSRTYVILVGNVLGKADYEAKERAKQILINDQKIFNGVYDQKNKACTYKEINASPSISNYPFKTEYETVSLIAFVSGEQMPQMMMKRHS